MNTETSDRISDLEDDSKDHEQRIAAIEARLGRLNLEVEGYMNDRFVPIEHRIAALEIEVGNLAKCLRFLDEIEERIAALEATIAKVERFFNAEAAIDRRITALEAMWGGKNVP